MAWMWLRPGPRFARRMRRLPAMQIAALREGQLARVTGRVRFAARSLTAPLTERRCVLYAASASDGMNVGIDIVERVAIGFWLDDGSARAFIRVAEFDCDVQPDYEVRAGLLRDPPILAAEFLARHRKSSTIRAIVFRESVIEEGDWVVIGGVCRALPDPDPRNAAGYRDSAIVHVLVAPPGGRLLISKHPTMVKELAAAPR